jgi:hypothetical protein
MRPLSSRTRLCAEPPAAEVAGLRPGGMVLCPLVFKPQANRLPAAEIARL